LYETPCRLFVRQRGCSLPRGVRTLALGLARGASFVSAWSRLLHRNALCLRTLP